MAPILFVKINEGHFRCLRAEKLVSGIRAKEIITFDGKFAKAARVKRLK